MPSKERITPPKKLKHKQCNTFKPHFPCAILNCLASTSWLMIRKFGWVNGRNFRCMERTMININFLCKEDNENI